MLTGIACCCAGGDAGAGAAAFGGAGALDFGSGGFCCAGVSRVILHISRPPASSIPATQAVTAKKDRTRIKARGRAFYSGEDGLQGRAKSSPGLASPAEAQAGPSAHPTAVGAISNAAARLNVGL